MAVLLGVDLGHFEVARAADEALYAYAVLGNMLAGIEIGNEPDDFASVERKLRPSDYDLRDYLNEAESYRQALSAAVPGVSIYGPALSGTSWLAQMGPVASMFTGITQHFYPISDCHLGPSQIVGAQQTAAEDLLSPMVRQGEKEVLNAVVHASRLGGGQQALIGETNGFSCIGAPSTSPALASALWALDWSLRASSSGIQGVSFHGGLGICGSDSQSPICAVSKEADRAGSVTAQAQYYGLLAARRLEGGRFVPASLSGAGPLADLTAWATLAPSGTLTIAVDDLAITGANQPVSIPARGYAAGVSQALAGSSAYARTGITLGHSTVSDVVLWRLRGSRMRRAQNAFHLVLRPASAVILTLYPRG